MSPRLLACLCLLIALPALAQPPLPVFSPMEIKTMHDSGVKMALEGERTPYVVPANSDPARLVLAETISFRGLDLQRLPPWLGRFTWLRHLDLAGTAVQAGQFGPLGNLAVLEHLDLTGVRLFADGGGLADLWPRLANLRILRLGNTGGALAAYGDLGPLRNLVELDLSGNGLSRPPAGLPTLRQLRRLNLAGSQLGALDPALLPPNLSELDLSNSALTGFAFRDGLDFPQLGALKLGGNPGLTIDPAWGDLFLMQQLVYLERDDTVAVPSGWLARLMRPQLETFTAALPGRMVALPAGCFDMGSPEDQPGRDSDATQHRVCVDAFNIGKYEVTFAEYDLFCEATGREKPSDSGNWGRDTRPVINVSWQDATAYAEWVSQITGQRYRLPTEAEWEYAARAGTHTVYWWGDEPGQGHANCDGCGSQWDHKQTAPVGSFPANPWGLYDTAGNVREWTCSAYGAYDGQREKRCASKNDAGDRALRGGSLFNNPDWATAAFRDSFVIDNHLLVVGLRLAQDR